MVRDSCRDRRAGRTRNFMTPGPAPGGDHQLGLGPRGTPGGGVGPLMQLGLLTLRFRDSSMSREQASPPSAPFDTPRLLSETQLRPPSGRAQKATRPHRPSDPVEARVPPARGIPPLPSPPSKAEHLATTS